RSTIRSPGTLVGSVTNRRSSRIVRTSSSSTTKRASELSMNRPGTMPPAARICSITRKGCVANSGSFRSKDVCVVVWGRGSVVMVPPGSIASGGAVVVQCGVGTADEMVDQGGDLRPGTVQFLFRVGLLQGSPDAVGQ